MAARDAHALLSSCQLPPPFVFLFRPITRNSLLHTLPEIAITYNSINESTEEHNNSKRRKDSKGLSRYFVSKRFRGLEKAEELEDEVSETADFEEEN